MNKPRPAVSLSQSRATRRVPGRPVDDMVILREDELASDPGAAMARIRSAGKPGENTRVLFVGPDSGSREAHELETRTLSPGLRRQPQPAPKKAQPRTPPRTSVLVGALQILAAELGVEMDSLQAALEAGEVQEVSQRSDTIAEMLGWLQAGYTDLHRELEGEAVPAVEVRIAEVLAEIAERLQVGHDGVQFLHGLPGDRGDAVVMGAPVAIRAAIRVAMELVAERIGGVGAVRAAAAVHGAEVRVELRGFGEPQVLRESERVDCLRSLMHRLGGRIEPCGLADGGPEGLVGMVICLPAAQGRGQR